MSVRFLFGHDQGHAPHIVEGKPLVVRPPHSRASLPVPTHPHMPPIVRSSQNASPLSQLTPDPQMDLQAQDRAHRIGQTRPVLIFRLVSAHTIETKILQKAGNKRKLEALVISQGKFGRVVDDNGKVILGRTKATKTETVADMAKALLDLEGEEINIASKDDKIISDADLEVLLDRSPAAFAREKGWKAGLGQGDKDRGEQIKKGEKTAFEVSRRCFRVCGDVHFGTSFTHLVLVPSL